MHAVSGLQASLKQMRYRRRKPRAPDSPIPTGTGRSCPMRLGPRLWGVRPPAARSDGEARRGGQSLRHGRSTPTRPDGVLGSPV